jgi:hypothetical protein
VPMVMGMVVAAKSSTGRLGRLWRRWLPAVVEAANPAMRRLHPVPDCLMVVVAVEADRGSRVPPRPVVFCDCAVGLGRRAGRRPGRSLPSKDKECDVTLFQRADLVVA